MWATLMIERKGVSVKTRDEHGAERIAVIAGVGTRHYYRRLGYELRPGDALRTKSLRGGGGGAAAGAGFS